ncbi:Uncharacterised protein [Streptococcus pneumoniae]|nr:Uncharacterised protein [Streptococcus pneumoniae]
MLFVRLQPRAFPWSTSEDVRWHRVSAGEVCEQSGRQCSTQAESATQLAFAETSCLILWIALLKQAQ